MLDAGELPNLAALATRGVTAELTTVKPLNSPTNWTTLATGRRPGAHRVTDFQATRLTVRVPTLFERLALRGRRVGLYDYLVTWPPAELPRGFVIPGWLRHDDRVSPPGLWERISLAPWVTRFEDEQTSDDFLELSRVEFAEKALRWNRLAEAFDLDLGAVVFYTVDTVSHRFWHAAHPEQFPPEQLPPEPWPAAHRTAIRDAVRRADRAVGEIRGALDDDDVLLVVSDHGFRASAEGVPNVWVPRIEPALADAGLEPGRDGFHLITRFGIVILEVHEGPYDAREAVRARLEAVLRSWRSREGEPLFDLDVIDVAEAPPGRRRPVFRRLRQWGLKQVVRRIYRMNTDRPGHAYLFARPRDEVLSRLWPDGRVQVAGAERAVREVYHRDAFPGDHAPIGIFLAAGGPIAHRRERERLSVLDLAPLVFYLSGASIPDDLEGELPTRILDAGYLGDHPPRRAAAQAWPGLPPVLESMDPVEDADLLDRLRRLGYVR